MAWLRGSGVLAVLAVAVVLTACGSQPVAGARGTGSFPALASASSPGTPSPGSSPPVSHSPGPSSPVSPPAGHSSPGSPPPAPRNARFSPAVVHLAVSFSPSEVRLRAGRQFLLIVSKDVQASGVAGPGPCPAGTVRPVAGGLLSARCMAGSRYLFTAKRTGTATVTATVRPQCAPGSPCPQWVTEPSLMVIIG